MLTPQQKKIMRKALCAGWFRGRGEQLMYRVSPKDLEDLAQMVDDDVITKSEAYRTYKLTQLNNNANSVNSEITDLNT